MTSPEISGHWLVTGAGGQVGSEVVRLLRGQGVDVNALDRSMLDITHGDDVDRVISGAHPDIVVNCAAWTAVDAAESEESHALLINTAGPENLAAACDRVGARLLQLSTDYVFDGLATAPIAEDAPIAPQSAYGRTKAGGERAVLFGTTTPYVVRTAWVYGAVGTNFVKTIARLASEREWLDVVDDQTGSPTWAADIARGLVALGSAPIDDCPPGIWHLTSGGETTWWEFAREIVSALGRDPEMVKPVSTTAFPRPAQRPTYSVLSNEKWRRHGLPPLPDWRDAFVTALPSLNL